MTTAIVCVRAAADVRLIGILALIPALLGCVTATSVTVLPPRVLARAPLCEASAAVVAPWDDRVVLIGDNENDRALFAMRRDPLGWLTSLDRTPLPEGLSVDDIEALAVADHRLLVVGSHGRSAGCERRPRRERLAVVAWDPAADAFRLQSWTDSTGLVDAALRGVGGCLEVLFVSPAPVGARAFCERLHELEANISGDRCTPPFDIEAAVAVLDPEGDRVWVGLRQPRVAGRPTLLRLAPDLQSLRFDAVAWLDADDRGLRGATRAGDELWFILGPGPPSYDRSTLWRARAADLVPGAIVPGDPIVDGLLPESEGLVVVGGIVTVVIDGDEAPERSNACSRPALQQLIRVQSR